MYGGIDAFMSTWMLGFAFGDGVWTPPAVLGAYLGAAGAVAALLVAWCFLRPAAWRGRGA